jgi:hypothetical protein
MTTTFDRPAVRRTTARSRSVARSPLGPGLLAAGWAAGAGLVTLGVPVLLVWATDSRSGSGAAAATRAIGQLWLLAHGASLTLPDGAVGLTPLGLALLPLALLHRAGRHGARTLQVSGTRQAARLVVAIGFPYALLGAVVAALCVTDQIRPAPVQAVFGGLAVGIVGAASGVLREARLYGETRRLPARLRRLCAGAGAATAALLAAGALLGLLSLLRHAGRASSLASATDPGLVGGLVLLVAGLVLVPNAAVWGASWLAGPGFAVGAGTVVGPFGTTLGPVPALPLLAALPSAPAPTWAAWAALAVPVGAGVLGGVLLGRRLDCRSGAAAVEGLLVGVLAGAALALCAWLSAGPLGGERMAQVGPTWWAVGLAVAAEVGAGAAAAAAVVRRS